MKLSVNSVMQTSSGGDHVTVYGAEIYFVECAAEVEVFGNESMTVVGDTALLGEVVDAIRRGAEEALRPHGWGLLFT